MIDDRTRDAHAKAAVLAEALPYIREFAGQHRRHQVRRPRHGRSPASPSLFAQDVVLMRLVGMNPVVVHGGGPQISDLMRRLGKEPKFVDGLRVTDAETIDIVRMALVGKVNREVVTSLNRHGTYAVGLSGEDAGLITVEQRDPRLGYVGDVRHIDPAILDRVLREELIPVIATVGVDDGRPGLQRQRRRRRRRHRPGPPRREARLPHRRPGLYRDFGDDDTLVSRIDVAGLTAPRNGQVGDGMIPKLRSCIDALRGGVHRAHILDGRLPHALLLEFFTREGIGTMVHR